jgi:hypothetical protein
MKEKVEKIFLEKFDFLGIGGYFLGNGYAFMP